LLADADITEISVEKIEYPTPQGIHLSPKVIIILVAFGVGIFICGMVIVCVILKQRSDDRVQII
jgi:hypothetical protein